MGDQNRKEQPTGIAPRLGEKKKQGSAELSDEELKKASGGRIFVKTPDKVEAGSEN